MANPNRPQYQETIESAWGQSVADHVVRRYGTDAERDADLAAFTPAELEGEVVIVNGNLQAYSHGAWIGRPVVVAAAMAVTTDQFGNWGFNLGPGLKLVSGVAISSQVSVTQTHTLNTQDRPVGSTSALFVAHWADTADNLVNATIGVAYVVVATY